METWGYGGTSIFWRPVSSLETSGGTEVLAGVLTGSFRQRDLLLEGTTSSGQDMALRKYSVFDWPTLEPRRVISLGFDFRGVLSGEVDEDSWIAV